MRLTLHCRRSHIFTPCSPGRGSISNLAEDEFSFHVRGSRSLHPNVVSSPDNDNASATSSRTTRSRARAEEVPSLPLGKQTTRKVVVDTDEENDELDLIGSSGFSEEGERAGKPRLETRTRGTTGNELLFADTATTRPRHREIANNSEPVRLLTTTVARTDTMEVVQDESSRNLESRDKDDAMDVEEVEAITKASDADGADQEAPESATVKSLTIVGGPTNKVPSRESSTSTPSKTPQTMAQITNPVNIPKPILISTSSVSNDEKVIIKQEGGTESGVAKREPFLESHQQFNPKYSLPPLNVLPADFTKKAKPIKRKKDKEREGKRDKDDTVPLGLARWGATLMANPLWRKVSRANKTLSTREWSVSNH